MKKIALSLMLVLLPIIAHSEDFQIGNLNYTISWDKTAVSVSMVENSVLEGELIIPETVTHGGVTYLVKYIKDNGFANTNITSAKLPNSITELWGYCFLGCSKLEKINLPQKITYLGYGTFYGCSSLSLIESHIYFPFDHDNNSFDDNAISNITLQVPAGSITKYRNALGWKDFSNIIEVEMEDVDKEMLRYTKIDNNNVSVAANSKYIDGSIVIPNEVSIDGIKYTVNKIEDNGFEKCSKISSISLPNTIKTIGWWAFAYTNIQNILLPEGLQEIGSWAFHGCSKLEKLLIPKNVSSFGWGVVSGDCHSLKEIVVEEGNNYIKEHEGILLSEDGTIMLAYAFGLSNENLIIPETVTSLNVCALFKENKTLKTITIPSGVKTIEGETFYGCSSLVKVELPDEIKEIEYNAFYGCTSLETITIPNSLSKISDDAFSGCSSIKSVIVRQNSPIEIPGHLFEEIIYNSATLYVPKGRLKYYEEASVWSNFSSIVEIDMPGIEPSNDPFDNLEDNQMILGHYSNSNYNDEYGYGGSEIGTYKAAIHFDGSRMNPFKATQIKTVRFALVKNEKISNFKIWIGKDRDNPLYTQNIGSIQKGWNTIELSEPFQIDGEGLYIGYEYHADQADVYPISIVEGDNEANSNFIYGIFDGVYQWYDESREGNIGIQCIVEGDIPIYNVAVKYVSLNEKYYKEGSEISGNVVLKNLGKRIPDSYNLFVQVDNSEPIQIYDVPNLGGTEQSAYFYQSFENLESGQHTIKAYIKDINGSVSKYTVDDISSSSFGYYKKSYVRNKVLIDYQTAQWCPSSPYFKLAFEELARMRDDYIIIANHNSDEFSIDGGEEYIQFYSFLPSLWFDRYAMKNASFFSYLIDPAAGTEAFYLANRMNSNINAVKQVPSFATINVSANCRKGIITINISGEREAENATIVDGTTLTVVLTENGLVGGQSDDSNDTYNEEYIHDNVLRKIVTKTWGDQIIWNNDKYEMSYTIDVNPEYDVENMHVVAFISKPYNGSNIDEIHVINADDCEIDTPDKPIVKAYHGFMGDIAIKDRFNAKGVTADGASQLIIYSKDDTELINATINLSTELGGKTEKAPQYVGTVSGLQLLDNGKYGYIYTAPDVFPGECVYSKIPLRINIKKQNGEELNSEITILRPAVIFLHGLKSDSSCFKELADYLKEHGSYDNIQLRLVSYKESNAASFYDNTYINKVVEKNANGVYQDLLDHGIVSAKYDLIGHSMGGILSRLYAQEGNADKVNRIITLDTPHSGSQLGDLGDVLIPFFKNDIKIKDFLLLTNPDPYILCSAIIEKKLVNWYYDNPALKSLATNSEETAWLNGEHLKNAKGIPVHAICSYMTEDKDQLYTIPQKPIYSEIPRFLLPYFMATLERNYGEAFRIQLMAAKNTAISLIHRMDKITKPILDNLFEEPFHDGVVSKTSQEGGLPAKNVTYETAPYYGAFGFQGVFFGEEGFDRKSWAHHMLTNKWIMTFQNIRDLLLTEKTSEVFSTEGFKPANLSHNSPILTRTNSSSSDLDYSCLPDTTQFKLYLAKEENNSIIDIKVKNSGNIINNITFINIDNEHMIISIGQSDYRFLVPDTCKGKVVIYALGQTKEGFIVGDSAFIHYNSDVELSSIKINKEDVISLKPYESVQLDVIGKWSNGEETYIIPTITTENGDMISISNDTIKAVEEGECLLYASYGGKYDSIKIKVTNNSTGILGDVNCDGVVNDLDVKDVSQYIIGNPPVGFDKKMADVNGDTKVDAADIVGIVNIIFNR